MLQVQKLQLTNGAGNNNNDNGLSAGTATSTNENIPRGILLRTQSKEVQHRLLCYPLGNIIVIFKKYTS